MLVLLDLYQDVGGWHTMVDKEKYVVPESIFMLYFMKILKKIYRVLADPYWN